MTLTRLLAALAALALVAACGDTGATADGIDDGPREGYPAGPYGVTTDAVIDDLSFTRPDGSALAFRDLYADGHNRLLLLTTAAGWCPSCKEHQPTLQNLHSTWGPRGLVVMVAIFEDAVYAPATAEDAAAWKARYDLDVEVVADTPFVLGSAYDATLTPLVLLIDVPSMKILWLTTGWDQSTVEAIIEAKL